MTAAAFQPMTPRASRRALRGRRLGSGVATTALALWAVAGTSPAQAQAAGWRYCAGEGQTCSLDGRGMVRFGVPGRWANKFSDGDIRCDTDTFGDPAPGRKKTCEALRSWNDPGEVSDGRWRFCAREGGDCDAGSSARVRFGANGRYTTRTMSGRFDCSVRTFGDPVPNVVKYCQIDGGNSWGGGGGWGGSGGGGGGGGGDRPGDGRWTYCANQDGQCRVPGTVNARYGDGKRWEYRTATGTIDCSSESFGTDPSPGRAKRCEWQATGGNGGGDWGGNGGNGGNGGSWGGGSNGGFGGSWRYCAPEGQTCRVYGSATVRYGADGSYNTRRVSGTISCNNDSFGGDPAPGRPKTCDVQR